MVRIATRLAVMSSKTVARSGTRTGRSNTSRGASRSAIGRAQKEVEARQVGRLPTAPSVAAGVYAWTALRPGQRRLMMAAGAIGGAARSIGRACDIEPGIAATESRWCCRPCRGSAASQVRRRPAVGVGRRPTFIGSAVVMLAGCRRRGRGADAYVAQPRFRSRLIPAPAWIGSCRFGLCHLWAAH